MIRPHVISHGANATRTDRSRFQLEFDWMGTGDPSAVLSVPTALRVLTDMLDGGWDAIHAHNHALALAGRRTLMAALAVEAPCPDDMVASMAALPLADARNHELPRSSLYADALQDALVDRYLVQVPIIPWPAPPRRLVRISAQLYNEPHQYERLATALTCALRAEQAH